MELRKNQLRRQDTSEVSIPYKGLTKENPEGLCQDGQPLFAYSALRMLATKISPSRKPVHIVLNHAYSKSKHDSRDQFVDPLTNRPMAKGQFTWLMRKGDLLLSDAPKEVGQEINFNFGETDSRVLQLPIYGYADDDLLDRFNKLQKKVL